MTPLIVPLLYPDNDDACAVLNRVGLLDLLDNPEDVPFLNKLIQVEELAEAAHMGMSTLHHHFRALTAMSPLQYQKQLRLVAARERMLANDLDAASAAFEVGYESPSQFNREYKRFLTSYYPALSGNRHGHIIS